MSNSNIYMIREYTKNGETGKYKIGYSGTPAKRISDLRAGNPRSLDFKHTNAVTDGRATEKAMEEALKWYHHQEINGGTEWYMVERGNFKEFENKYLQIAETHKPKSLDHLDHHNFILHSLEAAKQTNWLASMQGWGN